MSLFLLYRPFPRSDAGDPDPPGEPANPRRFKRRPTEDEWLGLVLRPEDGNPEHWQGYHR